MQGIMGKLINKLMFLLEFKVYYKYTNVFIVVLNYLQYKLDITYLLEYLKPNYPIDYILVMNA